MPEKQSAEPAPPQGGVKKAVLERTVSLPKIETKSIRERSPAPSLSSRSSSPSGYQSPQRRNTGGSTHPEALTPPNTKKLRMRSFLWIKPTTTASTSTSSTIAQVIPVLISNIGALSSGMALGYSAILLPQIKPDENPGDLLNATTTQYRPFTADMEQGSWIASIFGLGAIVGGLTAAYLGNKYGRRASLIMLSLIDLLSWVLVASSINYPMMLVGRFLAGFAAAGYSPNIQIYVAEITEAKNRGWMSGLTVPIMCIGTLIMYVLGSWLPWHLAAASCTPAPIFLALGMFFLYDSPQWYVQKGEEKMAYRALEKFRGQEPNNLAELFHIQEQIREQVMEVSFLQGLRLIVKERKYYKPFLILNCLFLFMIFSGKFAIEFYAVSIFSKTGSSVDEYLSAVIIALLQLVGSLMYLPLVKRYSRKVLIVLSAFIMSAALTVLGLCKFAQHADSGAMSGLATVDWLPLLSIVLYMVAAPIGLCSIPFLYIAEFFPAEMRSVLGGLTIAISNLELFVVVKTFPDLETLLGEFTVFWIYAGACLLAIVFTLSYIPETKDKSLLQVEDKFARRSDDLYRVSPWVSPMPSPSLNSVRKLQINSSMFTK